MKKMKLHAFTLVELIVVMTILAILATLAFTSFGGYTAKARNSTRVSDLKVIERAMTLFITVETAFPEPDNNINITYSGATAWKQGTFGSGAIANIGRISNVPIDPTKGVQYSYGITNNRKNYQVAAAMEGGFFSQNNTPLTAQSYALSGDRMKSYNVGNYLGYDVHASDGSNCYMLTAPSLILSDIPSANTLSGNILYDFAYHNSRHIPHSYSGTILEPENQTGFQVIEVMDSCTVNDIGSLELYLAQLSTAYQPLASIDRYKEIVFRSNEVEFQLEAIRDLQVNGITVDQSVIDTLISPTALRTFSDPFSAGDNTRLIGEYIPGPLESWSIIGSGSVTAYNIMSNRLEKSGGTSSLVFPVPSPVITSADYEVAFDVLDFSGGDISVFLRYTDEDNYYRLDINSSGYQVSRRVAGVDAVFQNISDPIANGSRVIFSVDGNSLVLTVNSIEKENILASGVDAMGNPAILLHNDGAQIDDYVLTYQ